MNHKAKTVCIISGGMTNHNQRLQPWRYVNQVATQLHAHGHSVYMISDAAAEAGSTLPDSEIPVHFVPSVRNLRWQPNAQLQRVIQSRNPDVLLWNVGVTSFLYQQLPMHTGVPAVGIFTSPIYSKADLARIGVRRLVDGYKLSGIHLLATMSQGPLLQRQMRRAGFQYLVVQTKTTKCQLIDRKLWRKPVHVIEPGVDAEWAPRRSAGVNAAVRAGLGYGADDVVILYFGSPAPLRGLHTLIHAFGKARRTNRSLKLLILSRRHTQELLREDAQLRQLLSEEGLREHIRVVSGFLDKETLTHHVAASDIVALPFELIPSDAPLSLLEAKALGKPVVTTQLACLPELVSDGAHYLAEPADPVSLAQALLAAAAANLQRGKPAKAAPVRGWQQMGEEWTQLIASL